MHIEQEYDLAEIQKTHIIDGKYRFPIAPWLSEQWTLEVYCILSDGGHSIYKVESIPLLLLSYHFLFHKRYPFAARADRVFQ